VSRNGDFVERQWRYVKRFMLLVPVWILLIAAFNIWDDSKGGQPLQWYTVAYPIGMIAFASVIFLFMRLIFKFVRRYVEHEDKRPKR